MEEQLKLRKEAQRRKDAKRAQINEIQSTSNSQCAEIDSAIASAIGQDQAIVQTWETIAKAQAYLEMTLKACESTIKTITKLSR